MPQIEIQETGGLAPLEVLGTIEGKPFYFRARGNSWNLTLSEVDSDPIKVKLDVDNIDKLVLYCWDYYGEPSDIYGAGYMPRETAHSLIQTVAERYCQGLRGIQQPFADPVKQALHMICQHRYEQLLQYGPLAKLTAETLEKFLCQQTPEVIQQIETQKIKHLQGLENWFNELPKRL